MLGDYPSLPSDCLLRPLSDLHLGPFKNQRSIIAASKSCRSFTWWYRQACFLVMMAALLPFFTPCFDGVGVPQLGQHDSWASSFMLDFLNAARKIKTRNFTWHESVYLIDMHISYYGPPSITNMVHRCFNTVVCRTWLQLATLSGYINFIQIMLLPHTPNKVKQLRTAWNQQSQFKDGM